MEKDLILCKILKTQKQVKTRVGGPSLQKKTCERTSLAGNELTTETTGSESRAFDSSEVKVRLLFVWILFFFKKQNKTRAADKRV